MVLLPGSPPVGQPVYPTLRRFFFRHSVVYFSLGVLRRAIMLPLILGVLMAISCEARSQTAHFSGYDLIVSDSGKKKPIRVTVDFSPKPFSTTVHAVLKRDALVYVLYTYIGRSPPSGGHPEFPELYTNIYHGIRVVTIKNRQLHSEEDSTCCLAKNKIKLEWRGPIFTAICNDNVQTFDIRHPEEGIE